MSLSDPAPGRPEAVRVLGQRELNRALLARQGLLERFPCSLPEALEWIGGIQAQYAPAMYVGLWSRVAGMRRDDLTRALEDRSVVQGTLLRSTIHLVSAADYWPFAVAIRSARRAAYLRVTRDGRSEQDWARLVDRLRDALRTGPLRQKAVDEVVGRDARAGVGLWLDLVRVPPSGTWDRRRADLYCAAADWLGVCDGDEEEAQELLLRRYLQGFGPASRGEIADWAGLPLRTVDRALGRLLLRRFAAEDGAELVDLPDAPLPLGDTPAPVRFLPTWDATLLAHARRSQILPERHRAKVFTTKTPHSVGTFLVDGSVAGTWRYEDGAIRVMEFEPLPGKMRREVDAEAKRLAAFHAC